MGNINNRVTRFAVGLFFVVLALAFTAKADPLTTWDFTFASLDNLTLQPNGLYDGGGSFQTLSLADSIKAGVFANDGLEIVSLDGTMNGSPMTLIPGFGTALDYPTLIFLDHALNFSVNGIAYFIHYNDTGAPPFGENLHGPNGYQSVALTLVATPEPSGISMLAIGIGLLGIAASAKRIRGANGEQCSWS